MRKPYFFFLLALLFALCTSCTPDETVEGKLEVDPLQLSFGIEGGTQSFTITSNADWTITVPEWITVDISSGKGNATISVTASANETEEVLTDKITVEAKSIDKIAEIQVTQSAYEYSVEWASYAGNRYLTGTGYYVIDFIIEKSDRTVQVVSIAAFMDLPADPSNPQVQPGTYKPGFGTSLTFKTGGYTMGMVDGSMYFEQDMYGELTALYLLMGGSMKITKEGENYTINASFTATDSETGTAVDNVIFNYTGPIELEDNSLEVDGYTKMAHFSGEYYGEDKHQNGNGYFKFDSYFMTEVKAGFKLEGFMNLSADPTKTSLESGTYQFGTNNAPFTFLPGERDDQSLKGTYVYRQDVTGIILEHAILIDGGTFTVSVSGDTYTVKTNFTGTVLNSGERINNIKLMYEGSTLLKNKVKPAPEPPYQVMFTGSYVKYIEDYGDASQLQLYFTTTEPDADGYKYTLGFELYVNKLPGGVLAEVPSGRFDVSTTRAAGTFMTGVESDGNWYGTFLMRIPVAEPNNINAWIPMAIESGGIVISPMGPGNYMLILDNIAGTNIRTNADIILQGSYMGGIEIR